MASTNPDFQYVPDAQQIVSLAGPELLAAQVRRDRQAEDYLRRHVLRRRRATMRFGDVSDHASVAYINVAPAIVITYWKATDRSVLAVSAHAHGFISAAAGQGWVGFGVNANLDGTSIGDSDVAFANFAGNGDWLHASGEVEVAGVGRGLVTLTMRVKVDAATTTFQSRNHSSLSIACVETHAP